MIPTRAVRRRDVHLLEEAAAQAWVGFETGRIGDWLLRAGGGFTGRANSCLPLGRPDRPLDDAIAAVQSWYAAQGLPAQFQLPTPLTRSLDALLANREWERHNETLMIPRRSSPLPMPSARMVATSRCAVRRTRRGLPAITTAAVSQSRPRDVVCFPRHPIRLGFARVVDGNDLVAIGRGAVTEAADGTSWLGLTAVEVAESARRRGLGRFVVTGLAAWGQTLGATQIYLQVAAENAAAIAMYEALGLTEHIAITTVERPRDHSVAGGGHRLHRPLLRFRPPEWNQSPHRWDSARRCGPANRRPRPQATGSARPVLAGDGRRRRRTQTPMLHARRETISPFSLRCQPFPRHGRGVGDAPVGKGLDAEVDGSRGHADQKRPALQRRPAPTVAAAQCEHGSYGKPQA